MSILKGDFDKMINKLFNLLDDWRNLPSYQLERRADIFFALFLDKIIESKYSTKIDIIIPEFPIRKGNLPVHNKYNKKPLERSNQSFHIDYLAYSKSKNLVFLIELKTEMESRNDKQDWYLKEAEKLGLKGLVDGIYQIMKATKQKEKYEYLVKRIEEMKWGDKSHHQKPHVIYIQPYNKKNNPDFISFEEVRETLMNIDEPLAKRFSESLKVWK